MLPTGKIIIPGSNINPKNGCIALWEFEETAGTTAGATVGSNNLTYLSYGVYPGYTGRIGKCVFGDTNGYSYMNKYGGTWNLPNTTMSFNFWVKSVSSFGALTQAYSTPGWEIGVSSTGVRVELKDSNSATKDFTASFTNINSVWMMFTIVVDTGEVRVYKNAGTPVSSTWSHTGNFTLPTTTFYLSNGAAHDDWDGYFDQSAIWNRALTAEEITYLYNSGSGRAYSSWV